MADQNQSIDMTLRQTLNTLSEGISSTTPDQGANLIDEWVGIVRSEAATQ